MAQSLEITNTKLGMGLREVGTCSFLAGQPSLLGEFQGSERPSVKQNNKKNRIKTMQNPPKLGQPL